MPSEKNHINCPICDHEMLNGLTEWHFMCLKCRYECSKLTITIKQSTSPIDEDHRILALKSLRIHNFEKSISIIKKYTQDGSSLLEIGSGYGWFMDIAKTHFKTTGIEPDDNVRRKDHNTINGFFPDCINDSQKFNVIVFNDSLEHIPEINKVFQSIKNTLEYNGIVFINIPTTDGFFYRTSKIFQKIGITNFFTRMWQENFPSPHVHYFNIKNLNKIAEKNDMTVVETGHMKSIDIKSLKSRISYDKNSREIKNFIIYISILILTPIIKLLPNDSIYIVLKQKP